MIDRNSLRKMCEYPITPSLIGEIEPVKETARERADRIWKMEGLDESRLSKQRSLK
jgi:hypothetical protein